MIKRTLGKRSKAVQAKGGDTMHAMQPWDSQTAALAVCALDHLIAFSGKLHHPGHQLLVSFAALPVATARVLLGNVCISAARH